MASPGDDDMAAMVALPECVERPPCEVGALIEELAVGMLEALVREEPPSLLVPRRSVINTALFHDDDGMPVLRTGGLCVEKRLTLAGARSFARIWKLLDAVHALVSCNKTATQRELYYMGSSFFLSQAECNEGILDVAGLLRVPRHCLGVTSTVKGNFCGRLQYRFLPPPHAGLPAPSGTPCSSWTVASATAATTISNEFVALPIRFSSDARFVLVIEKDGVFQRLLEDGFADAARCIMVTGKGFPDLATRAFVKKLQTALGVPVYGLADYNPYGLALLLTYKVGSARMGFEASKYAADVKWLGLRHSDVEELQLPAATLVPLTRVDVEKIAALRKHPFIKTQPAYDRELSLMLEMGRKVDLEACLSRGFACLPELIMRKVEAGDAL